MQTNRITPLDSLRGLAAIGVAFFWHYQHFQPQNNYPLSDIGYWFYHYGWNLVDFFFVLSGFIFSYVYREKIAKKEVEFKDYTMLRISRLYPLQIITLLFVAIVQFIRILNDEGFFVYQNNDIYHFILNIFFIQGDGFEKGWSFNAPTWSVSSELIAYILFFIVAKYLYKNKIYLRICIFLVAIGLLIVLYKLQYPLVNEKVGRVLIGFFIGCVIFSINRFINNNKNKGLFVMLGAVIFTITTLYLIMVGHHTNSWQYIYTVIMYPLIIIFSLNIKLIYRILSLKPLVYLGKMSYSVYLWHFPIQLTIATINDVYSLKIDFSSIVIFFIYVVITLIISAVSFETIEKPFSKLIRRKLIHKKKT